MSDTSQNGKGPEWLRLADGAPVWEGARVWGPVDEPPDKSGASYVHGIKDNGCLELRGFTEADTAQPWRYRLDVTHRPTFLMLINAICDTQAWDAFQYDGGDKLLDGWRPYEGFALKRVVTPESIIDAWRMADPMLRGYTCSVCDGFLDRGDDYDDIRRADAATRVGVHRACEEAQRLKRQESES